MERAENEKDIYEGQEKVQMIAKMDHTLRLSVCKDAILQPCGLGEMCGMKWSAALEPKETNKQKQACKFSSSVY